MTSQDTDGGIVGLESRDMTTDMDRGEWVGWVSKHNTSRDPGMFFFLSFFSPLLTSCLQVRVATMIVYDKQPPQPQTLMEGVMSGVGLVE